jgi:hypothetical protein
MTIPVRKEDVRNSYQLLYDRFDDGPFKVNRKYEERHTYSGTGFNFHISEIKLFETNEKQDDDEFFVNMVEQEERIAARIVFGARHLLEVQEPDHKNKNFFTSSRKELKELADLIYHVLDEECPKKKIKTWGIKD